MANRNIFVDSVLNTNFWTYTIKDFNVQNVLGRLYEKTLLSKL